MSDSHNEKVSNPFNLEPPKTIDVPLASDIQMLREYVAGSGYPIFPNLKRSLSHYLDDVTQDFGIDIYDRMMRDSDVASAVQTRKLAVLSDGYRIVPESGNARGVMLGDQVLDDSEIKLAGDYAQFVARRLDDMELSLHDIAYELLDKIAYGHKLAEKVGKTVKGGIDDGKFGWRTVKTRSKESYSFIIDAWNNVLGFLAVQPGKGVTALPSFEILGDLSQLEPWFLPREKFLIIQNGTKDSDPRGVSDLRLAYNAWFLKTQVYPIYFSYLRRWGEPSLVGKTPDNADELTNVIDESGNKVLNAQGQPKRITKQEALRLAMLEFQSGSVLAVPGGTEIEALEPGNTSSIYEQAFDYLGKQITQSILKTSRATKEAARSSKADAATAMDVFQYTVYFDKIQLADVLTRELLRPLIEKNFGPEKLYLCPRLSFTATEKSDKAALIRAYALLGYQLDDSQFAGVDAEVGAPVRDMQKFAERREMESQVKAMGAHTTGTFPAVSAPAAGGSVTPEPTNLDGD